MKSMNDMRCVKCCSNIVGILFFVLLAGCFGGSDSGPDWSSGSSAVRSDDLQSKGGEGQGSTEEGSQGGAENISPTLREFIKLNIKPPAVEKFDGKKLSLLFKKLLDEVESPSPECGAAPKQGIREVRLVTQNEYIKSVNFIFNLNLSQDFADAFLPPDTFEGGFRHLRNMNVMSGERLDYFLEASAALAKQLVKQESQILNCGQGDAASCFLSWSSQKLPLLWRRQISQSDLEKEKNAFIELGKNVEALGLMAQRYVMSPYFLYRSRIGSQGKLTDWEVATALSDFFWAGTLDQSLVQKAQSKQLNTASQIESEAQRLISDEKFFDGLSYFVDSWLEMFRIRSRGMNPNGGIQLKSEHLAALSSEMSVFLYHLIMTGQSSFENIFNSDFTFGPDIIADIYKFSVAQSGVSLKPRGVSSEFKKLNLSQGMGGVFSQPSMVLSISSEDHTNIPLRGRQTFAKFMCYYLETPEGFADAVNGATFDKNLSALAALDQVTKSPVCAGCHAILNGPGAALEKVSPLGLARVQDDHGQPAKSIGWLASVQGTKVPVDGVKQFSQALSQSLDGKVCSTVQAFRMIYSRLETAADRCEIASVYQTASASKSQVTLKSIMIQMFTSPAFLNRGPSQG